MIDAGAVLVVLVVLMALFPRVSLYPLGAFVLWIAVALLARGIRLCLPKSQERYT
jgi:hypothetical protein